MDGALGKFSLYDFMGIWGPGAISLFYFTFTLKMPIIKLLNACNLEFPSLSENALLILLYSIVAYIIGMTLHELGHWLCGILITIKHLLKKPIDTIKQLRLFVDIKHFFMTTDEILDEARLKYDSSETTKCASFDDILTLLKRNASSGTLRIDKYHAVYAMARSIMIMAMVHFCVVYIASSYGYYISPFISYLDIVIFLMFFIRTCRYYSHWVETVCVLGLKISDKPSREGQNAPNSCNKEKTNFDSTDKEHDSM